MKEVSFSVDLFCFPLHFTTEGPLFLFTFQVNCYVLESLCAARVFRTSRGIPRIIQNYSISLQYITPENSAEAWIFSRGSIVKREARTALLFDRQILPLRVGTLLFVLLRRYSITQRDMEAPPGRDFNIDRSSCGRKWPGVRRKNEQNILKMSKFKK